MKALGVVRKTDELGRIVIPIEFRRAVGIDKGTPIEMFAEDGSLILRKYKGHHRQEQKAQVLTALEDLQKNGEIFTEDIENIIDYVKESS